MNSRSPIKWWQMKAVTAKLEPEQLEALRAIAKRNNVSPSAYVRAIIIDAIAEESSKGQIAELWVSREDMVSDPTTPPATSQIVPNGG